MEHCTALVEHVDGRIEIVGPGAAAGRPQPSPEHRQSKAVGGPATEASAAIHGPAGRLAAGRNALVDACPRAGG